jgi:nitroimidazol reductase NimA-like FMN-containing flavoprotein (pyridoxamine 5'-phosphate oxidase superfamily)
MADRDSPADDALRDMARQVLADVRYLVLGTTEADGRSRVSPVYVTWDGPGDFYWVSSPVATHSRNVARRPEVSGVVFDSSQPPGRTAAVYLTATAREVPADELPEQCARAFRRLSEGARAFAPEELSGSAALRLYHGVMERHEVHVRGSDPTYGRGVDTRLEVDLG